MEADGRGAGAGGGAVARWAAGAGLGGRRGRWGCGAGLGRSRLGEAVQRKVSGSGQVVIFSCRSSADQGQSAGSVACFNAGGG